MKKLLLTFLITIHIGIASQAQQVEDGIKALYYERYNEATTILNKIVTNNPKDAKAIYWLGQAYVQNKDIAIKDGIEKTQTLYQSGLNHLFNEPILVVGMGEIDLLHDNNITLAKQKFDQAVLTSKNNPDILNAIGRASSAGDKQTGDPAYAIELLKKAKIGEPKNSDINYNLALNYLKIGDKQKAIDALLESTRTNPQYAKGFYELARMDNLSITDVKNYIQKGIAADPNFGPIYLLAYSNSLHTKDYNAAEEYIKKYITLTENGIKAQYFLGNVLLLKDDKAQAQKAFSNYITNTPSQQLITGTYNLAGQAYTSIPDSAKDYFTKAFNSDTSFDEKRDAADSLIAIFKSQKDSINTYIWTKKLYQTVPTFLSDYKKETVLPQLCAAAVRATPLFQDQQEFSFIDSAFANYITLHPDKEFGYFGRAKIAISSDVSLQKAYIPISNYITFLEQEKAKNKTKLVYYYDLLGQYFTNTKKDYKNATKQYQYILAIDPSNTRAKDILTQLSKMKN